jgi:4-amino-4-deoxy-L-arabinose transferase-like glycosyltransferase
MPVKFVARARRLEMKASWLVVVLLLAHAGLLAWSAWRHSPVATEVGHLPAGISHWQSGRFDLYRVNPPLVRLVATLPVLGADPRVDWTNYSTDPTTRSESLVGFDFVSANGSRTFWLFTLGRWACIPFSLVGAWVCYCWARDLYGPRSGVVAAALWCFCPNILGNSSLIMPDVPAAALGAAAGYTFWRWLKIPSWGRAATCGVVLGLAELTKTTLIVFYFLWPLLWVVYRLPERHHTPGRSWRSESGMLAAQLLLSLYVLNLGYLFEGSFQPLGDYRFKSHALTGFPADGPHEIGNRFADTALASLPVPVPKNYLQGIDAQKVDFERGMWSYLRGRWSERGWWYFYLYALAIKVPVGTWVLVLLATGLALTPRARDVSKRDALLLLTPPVVLFALVSSQSGFSVHFRYLLPVFPFAFVWASQAAVLLSARGRGGSAHAAGLGRRPLSRHLGPATVWAALAWSIGSSMWYYPHSLSYFNELVGGPENGHEHLLESNIDWGQDLFYLKEWYDTHPEARPFHFTGGQSIDPRAAGLGIEFAPPPEGPDAPSSAGSADQRALGPLPGWYAVSVYYLHGPPRIDSGGQGGPDRPHQERFGLTYFRRFRPIAKVGYSIYVYHITPDEANRVRRELQLCELDLRVASHRWPSPEVPAGARTGR